MAKIDLFTKNLNSDDALAKCVANREFIEYSNTIIENRYREVML